MLSTSNITYIHKHTLTFHVYRKKWKGFAPTVSHLIAIQKERYLFMQARKYALKMNELSCLDGDF